MGDEKQEPELDLAEFCQWAGFSPAEQKALSLGFDSLLRVAGAHGKSWKALLEEYLQWKERQNPPD